MKNNFRTYHRRSVTRTSGYHVCDDTTGGECIIKKSTKLILAFDNINLIFKPKNLKLVELFENRISIFGFGGYIKSDIPTTITFNLSYNIGDSIVSYNKTYNEPFDINDWNNIGFHKEINTDFCKEISNVTVTMNIKGEIGTTIQFVSFNYGIIDKEDFISDNFKKSFYQKTSMHIPYLYYFEADTNFLELLKCLDYDFQEGESVVLKSCNRCGRFLPINELNELKTLSFSLHCKKSAPCRHSTFSSYTILNYEELDRNDLKSYHIVDRKLISYYGHQLECKACKKFFVNAPLNPQRNAQQFKEDGLRRRALETLINTLLHKNLIHFEFENKTKKEFSKYIWEKFGKKCFKCKQDLLLDEMHLDHTLPLAYLYRLDESATCLCSKHNSQKRDHFPVEYYTTKELEELSKITKLPLDTLKTKEANPIIIKLLIKNIVWFFDEFLATEDYQKIRDGRLTADKILASLQRVFPKDINLVNEYIKRTNKFPSTITQKKD